MSKRESFDITDKEFQLLDWVLKNPNHAPADYFFVDPTVDGRVEVLERIGLVSCSQGAGMNITELGRAVLVEHNEARKKNRKRLVWEIIRFAVPTIISVISLIISILK